jgi:hypothetical protein
MFKQYLFLVYFPFLQYVLTYLLLISSQLCYQIEKFLLTVRNGMDLKIHEVLSEKG